MKILNYSSPWKSDYGNQDKIDHSLHMIIMFPALIGGALSDAFQAFDWRLSVRRVHRA